MENTERRALNFIDFAEVLSVAESLSAEGYVPRGKWDLAQVCDHLAAWLTFPMDGFPRPPLPMRIMLCILRRTVGRRELTRVIDTGHLPPAGPTFRSTVLSPGRNADAAIKRLRRVMARFESFNRTLHPSPLYGPLTYQQWHRLHLIHCAHHLSWLIPTKPSEY